VDRSWTEIPGVAPDQPVFPKNLVLGMGFRPLLMQLFPPVDIRDADRPGQSEVAG